MTNIDLKRKFMYTEIFRLKDMLAQAGIPFEFRNLFDGFQICYPSKSNYICSVIEHMGSYGHTNNLLEIMGLLTASEKKDDDVVGYLTAENVFRRIQEHWKYKRNVPVEWNYQNA